MLIPIAIPTRASIAEGTERYRRLIKADRTDPTRNAWQDPKSDKTLGNNNQTTRLFPLSLGGQPAASAAAAQPASR